MIQFIMSNILNISVADLRTTESFKHCFFNQIEREIAFLIITPKLAVDLPGRCQKYSPVK